MYKLKKQLIENGFIKFQNLIDKKLLKKINELSSSFVLNQNIKEKKSKEIIHNILGSIDFAQNKFFSTFCA